jgi:hypothetical protein
LEDGSDCLTRGGGRNYTSGQANPLEVAPRKIDRALPMKYVECLLPGASLKNLMSKIFEHRCHIS